MNWKLCVTLSLAVLLGANLCSADAPDRAEVYSIEALRARLHTLSSEAQALELQIDALRNDGDWVTNLERAELEVRLHGLQEQLARLHNDLGTSNLVYGEALASRNGTMFFPQENQPANAASSVMNLSDVSADEQLEISGFMDAVYELNAVADKPNKTYLNQVEIDLVRPLGTRAGAELGVVYADGFEVGAAVISYDIKPASADSTSLLKSWSASAGQFDAPFGEDVGYYPSNQRKTISIPSAITGTHNCWNHIGARTNFNLPETSVDLWTVQGFDLQSNSGLEEPLEELNFSAGGRVNLDVVSGVRIGGSLACGWLSDGNPAMQLYGAHCVLTQGDWSFIGEGILLDELLSASSLHRRGGYIQALRQINRFFLFGRTDYIEGTAITLERRQSLGGGADLGAGLEIRSEYIIGKTSAESQGLLQIVASF